MVQGRGGQKKLVFLPTSQNPYQRLWALILNFLTFRDKRYKGSSIQNTIFPTKQMRYKSVRGEIKHIYIYI